MTDATETTRQTLAALGISAAAEVADYFAVVRAQFERDAATAADDAAWKFLRDAWIGRKSGVLTRITDNWLKTASTRMWPR